MSDAHYEKQLAHAFGAPLGEATFRQHPEDFQVDEELGFSPAGEGEHIFLHLRKRGENTAWIAEKLAEYFAVKPVDVGYCGKKDRHAETTQWFSIYAPKTDTAFDAVRFAERFAVDVSLLAESRHRQKLRRGAHRSNHFRIRLRDLSDPDDGLRRLAQIATSQVPNYFGEQRFGREGGNLGLARAWIEAGEMIRHRGKRGMVMSAARSFLFNAVLDARVRAGNWRECLEGDVALDGLPTAPLWGRGRSATQGLALDLEQRVLAPYAAWCDKLEHVGLSQERRSLVLRVDNLSHAQEGSDLCLSFSLAPGEYATAVLRELCVLRPA